MQAWISLACMDYAFVPGFGIKELDLVRAVQALRPNTQVVVDRTLITVSSFVLGLDLLVGLAVIDPAGNLIAGSHGDGEGELLLAMDKSHALLTNYETLEAVKTSGTIEVPPDLGASNPNFRLIGCLIGSDETLPFLRLMKQALKRVNALSAPRFVHTYQSAPDGSNAFEYMKYAYRIVSKDRLTTRDAVVGKFGNAGLHQALDGSDVPDDRWEVWVPPEPVLKLASMTSQKVSFVFPVVISPAAGGNSMLFQDLASWNFIIDHYLFDVELDSVPTGDAALLALVPQALAQEPDFQDNHPYPVFRRHHFKTRQAFIDGFQWRPTVMPNNTVSFVGTRYRYELHIPVLKPGTAELIYNFYPITGTPIINFTESNQPFKLFGVV